MIDKISIYYRDKLSVVHTEFVVEEYKGLSSEGDKDGWRSFKTLLENTIKYGDVRKIAYPFQTRKDYKQSKIQVTP